MTFQAAESLPDRLRSACAWIAARASSVRIEEGAIEDYARELLQPAPGPDPDPETQLVGADPETLSAFSICINAINFGSGWWPTIEKRPGRSGYSTIAAAVTDRFRSDGAWSAEELAELDAVELASTLGQDPEHPLMEHFASSLRDVGVRVLADHDGSFNTVVDAATGSAIALAELLAGWEAFADVSIYREHEVPFFKRAQLAAADLDRAGVASFADRARLTAFADNLVPHVLRVDGILRLDPVLEGRIEAEELLEHGAPEEVELRACAVHATELLCAAIDRALSPPEIDSALWNRGRLSRYKAIPRPRSRNTAY